MGMLGKVSAAVKAETEGEVPRTFLDKVITSTPVVMTVVATILAGLSSSEMSTAQYHRSVAAQNQSKAGDQWEFYQAKRGRGASVDNTLDVLSVDGSAGALDRTALEQSAKGLVEQAQYLRDALHAGQAPDGAPSGATASSGSAASELARQFSMAADRSVDQARQLLAQWDQLLSDPLARQSLDYLHSGNLPTINEKEIRDEDVKEALAAIDANKQEEQITPIVRKVDAAKFDEALAAAQENARAFDAALKPVEQAIDRMSKLVAAQTALARKIERQSRGLPGAASDSATQSASEVRQNNALSAAKALAQSLRERADEVGGDFVAARLRFASRKYQAESRYNMATAQLFELDVRRSAVASERHRERSKNFFYGMLAAQAAVTIATLSLAVRQRSLLWTMATGAGAIAVALGIYVYLFT